MAASVVERYRYHTNASVAKQKNNLFFFKIGVFSFSGLELLFVSRRWGKLGRSIARNLRQYGDAECFIYFCSQSSKHLLVRQSIFSGETETLSF